MDITQLILINITTFTHQVLSDGWFKIPLLLLLLWYNDRTVYCDRLKCRDGGLGFGVEVIKHGHSDLGAVLLYHNNQHVVAAAYSIDNYQLPQSSQVCFNCCLFTIVIITSPNLPTEASAEHTDSIWVDTGFRHIWYVVCQIYVSGSSSKLVFDLNSINVR